MKHTLLLLILLANACLKSIAQPVIKVQKTIGGSFFDDLRSMYLTKDGGLIVGGSSESDSSGDKTEDNTGIIDYWLVKLNKKGKIQWDKTIGGSYDDQLSCIQQTSDGGYILGGSSESNRSGQKSENSKGSYDYWVVKLDRSGNIEWDKTIGGSDYDALACLEQTCDGGYILGGQSFSNKSGDKTGNSRGADDYWVVKLDKHGKVQWDKTIGGSDFDVLYSLQQTNDSGYILGGSSTSNISGEKTENSRGDYDYWIVKLDKHGRIQWDKTIGGSDFDVLHAIQQTSDGGYILGGTSSSGISGEKTESNRGLYHSDYWIVKLSSEAQIQWDKTIGGVDDDFLYSLQQTSDKGYILGGYSYSNTSGEKTENSKGEDDYWVVKINKYGKVEWDKTIGGNHFERLSSIKEIQKNWYMLGGSSSSDISGDKTENPRGGPYDQDYWVVVLQYKKPQNITSRISNDLQKSLSENKSGLLVFPNPVKDVLHVQTGVKTTVQLTDQSGRILITQNVSGSGFLNVSHLPVGLYYLKNTITGETQKIIIVR